MRSPLFAAALVACVGCGGEPTGSTSSGGAGNGGTSTSTGATSTGGVGGTSTGVGGTAAGGTAGTSTGGTAGSGGTSTAGTGGTGASSGGSGGSGGSIPLAPLDPTFGTDGIVTGAFGFTSARTHTGVRKQDGSFVLIGTVHEAGYVYLPDVGEAFLVGMTAAGQLDTTFGNAGQTLTAIHAETIPRAAVVQADGKIVVAGYAERDIDYNHVSFLFVARYHPNGTLDPTFGGGDGFIAELEGEGRDVALQSDGKILVTDDLEDRVLRFHVGGALDQTFGMLGQVLVKDASRIAVGGDDSIVVSGDGPTATVTRLLPEGDLDPTFDGDGVAAFAALTNPAGVALQPDGKVLVCGEDTGTGAALLRLDTDGAPDTMFGGGDGLVTHDVAGEQNFKQVTITPAGDIVVYVGPYPMSLMRFLADGTPDPMFGTGGLSEALTPSPWIHSAIFVLADDSVVAMSSLQVANSLFGGQPVAWRVLPGGLKDTAFAGDGRFERDTHAAVDIAQRMTMFADGSFVTAGTIHADTEVGITRHTVDGALDPTFGNNGVVLPPLHRIDDMVASADGVWASGGDAAGAVENAIVRYTPAGQPDVGFGTNGLVILSPTVEYTPAVELGPQGTVMLATTSNGEQVVARLLPDGSFDPAFGGGDGVAPWIGGDFTTRDMVTLPDGTAFVLALDFATDIAVGKLSPDGTLDPTFGNGGDGVANLAPYEEMDRLSLQPDGKVLFAGYDGAQVAVWRLDTAGLLDATFGVGGRVKLPLPALGSNVYGQRYDGPRAVPAPDGSLYLACATVTGHLERVAVAHLDASGGLDVGFGNGGWKVAGNDGNWAAYDAALQPGGKLVIAGRGYSDTTGTDFGWMRLDP